MMEESKVASLSPAKKQMNYNMFKDKRASEFFKNSVQNKSDLNQQLDMDFIREAKVELRFKEVSSSPMKKKTQQVNRKKPVP